MGAGWTPPPSAYPEVSPLRYERHNADPRVTLPDGAKPVAAVVGAPGAFVSLGPANTYEPRPVLCLQPMTAADARYSDGRRAGLLEAAALLRGAAALLGGGTGANALRCGAEEIEAIAARTGEP